MRPRLAPGGRLERPDLARLDYGEVRETGRDRVGDVTWAEVRIMLFRHARAGVPELLQPHPSQAMRTYWVSMAVNNVKNYGPECIESA